MANVIQSAISSIRRKADELLNDNQGWFRGGKFTPLQQVQDIKTDLPANLAYGQAKIAQKILPKEYIPSYQAGIKYQNSPLGQFENKNWGAIESVQKPIEKSFSAQLNPYPVVAKTPQNIALEKQKQEIINSGAFRPAQQRYLSTVPVNYEPNLGKGSGLTQYGNKQDFQKDVQGGTWETDVGPQQPLIMMGNAKKNIPEYNTVVQSQDPNLNPVLAHELIHASAHPLEVKKEFTQFFNNLNPQQSPILWKSGLTYLRNGQKPPNPEELYATLAQNIGPDILNNPEVAKFFNNLFQQK